MSSWNSRFVGYLILISCVIMALAYLIILFAPGTLAGFLGVDGEEIRFWAVAIPVLIAVIGVLIVGSWMGYAMASTPPPREVCGEELDADE